MCPALVLMTAVRQFCYSHGVFQYMCVTFRNVLVETATVLFASQHYLDVCIMIFTDISVDEDEQGSAI